MATGLDLLHGGSVMTAYGGLGDRSLRPAVSATAVGLTARGLSEVLKLAAVPVADGEPRLGVDQNSRIHNPAALVRFTRNRSRRR